MDPQPSITLFRAPPGLSIIIKCSGAHCGKYLEELTKLRFDRHNSILRKHL